MFVELKCKEKKDTALSNFRMIEVIRLTWSMVGIYESERYKYKVHVQAL